MNWYPYAYLIADGVIGVLWVSLFLIRKDLRRKMLLLSIIIGFLGPIGEFWFLRDYWHPQILFGWSIGLEDYLFMFFAGGIASVIYQAVFGFKITETERKPGRKFAWFVLGVLLVPTIIANILMFGFGVNSMYSGIVAMMLVAATIAFMRKDFIVNSLLSGILMSVVMFLGYIAILRMFPELIHRWWYLDNLSGVLVAGVPLEELLWGFSFGAMMGPLYEFISGHRIEKRIYAKI